MLSVIDAMMKTTGRSTFLGMGPTPALEWNDASVRMFEKGYYGQNVFAIAANSPNPHSSAHTTSVNPQSLPQSLHAAQMERLTSRSQSAVELCMNSYN